MIFEMVSLDLRTLLAWGSVNECVTNHVMCLEISNCHNIPLQMKSTEVDPGLFTDSYCKVCSAQLISESQRVAHYEVSNAHTHVHIKHTHLLIPLIWSAVNNVLRSAAHFLKWGQISRLIRFLLLIFICN